MGEQTKKTAKGNGAVTAWEVIFRWIKGQSSFFQWIFREYLSSIKCCICDLSEYFINNKELNNSTIFEKPLIYI